MNVFYFGISLNIPDGPALSLDINQSAVSPTALAMAILSSSKSRRKTRSSPQVPLVIISQPVPAPPTADSTSPTPPPLSLGKPDETVTEEITSTELELDEIQLMDPDEVSVEVIQTSSDMTSLPVINEALISEGTDGEDTFTQEVAPGVSSCVNQSEITAVNQLINDKMIN